MLAGWEFQREAIMKRLFACFIGCAALVLSASAMAQDPSRPSISLETPAWFAQQACPAPVWNGVIAVWKGTTDTRHEKVIGVQTKKGQEPIEVVANPPLDAAFDKALRDLFVACGMKFVEKTEGETPRLSAEIKDFYAGVEKKLVTGKSVAKSMLTLVIDKGITTKTVDVGMEMESKDVRKGDIKGLTNALNKLFIETLKQIPTTQQLRDLK